MTVTVRPVKKADLPALFDLKVGWTDQAFVAPNEITLAEAAFEKGAHVFTIWAGDTRVGLIALIDMTQQDDAAPEDEPDSALIWRLMVGEEHQGKGYGTAAIRWALDWARRLGRPRMSVEVVETNTAAKRFYARMGFVATGVMYGTQAQMARDL